MMFPLFFSFFWVGGKSKLGKFAGLLDRRCKNLRNDFDDY